MLDASRTLMEPQEASRLAKEVLSVDRSIISVGIISNNSTPLGGAVADVQSEQCLRLVLSRGR